ncbi:MAG: hypothetical protein ACR2FL_02625, partial [Nocardioidaceae bacterium]
MGRELLRWQHERGIERIAQRRAENPDVGGKPAGLGITSRTTSSSRMARERGRLPADALLQR